MKLLKKIVCGARDATLNVLWAVKNEFNEGVSRPSWWIVTAAAVLLGRCLQCF